MGQDFESNRSIVNESIDNIHWPIVDSTNTTSKAAVCVNSESTTNLANKVLDDSKHSLTDNRKKGLFARLVSVLKGDIVFVSVSGKTVALPRDKISCLKTGFDVDCGISFFEKIKAFISYKGGCDVIDKSLIIDNLQKKFASLESKVEEISKDDSPFSVILNNIDLEWAECLQLPIENQTLNSIVDSVVEKLPPSLKSFAFFFAFLILTAQKQNNFLWNSCEELLNDLNKRSSSLCGLSEGYFDTKICRSVIEKDKNLQGLFEKFPCLEKALDVSRYHLLLDKDDSLVSFVNGECPFWESFPWINEESEVWENDGWKETGNARYYLDYITDWLFYNTEECNMENSYVDVLKKGALELDSKALKIFKNMPPITQKLILENKVDVERFNEQLNKLKNSKIFQQMPSTTQRLLLNCAQGNLKFKQNEYKDENIDLLAGFPLMAEALCCNRLLNDKSQATFPTSFFEKTAKK